MEQDIKSTKAGKLISIADWLKKQNYEFVKNFKGIKSVARAYDLLPPDYDKTKKIETYVKKNKDKQSVEIFCIAVNALFEFRYFEDAPKRYIAWLSLATETYRNGDKQLKVVCRMHDRFQFDARFPNNDMVCSINIKSLADAKRAVDRHIEEEKKKDVEWRFSDRLANAMKSCDGESDEKLQVLHHIYF